MLKLNNPFSCATNRVVKLRFAKSAARTAVALVTMAAWFVASDHCALAAAVSPIAAPSGHEHCPGHKAPAKGNSHNDGLTCCKSLAAPAVAPAKNLVCYDAALFVVKNYFLAELIFQNEHNGVPRSEWDTGPPGADSFAESVLQRSVLAHAPPISLS